MATIRVTHTIDSLRKDLSDAPVKFVRKGSAAVRKNTRAGNRIGKGIARKSAGAHGKHYHKAWTAEMVSPLVGVYGPDSAMPQGGMSFNGGSRNQPPHLDLEKSQDLMRPQFYRDVDDVLDSLL